MQAAVTAVFREGGSHTIFREVKHKFVFVGETCPGGIFNAAVPVCFHLILAPQVFVNIPLCFVEHLHEGEGNTRRHLGSQHGYVFGDPCRNFVFGGVAAGLVIAVDGIQDHYQSWFRELRKLFGQGVRIFVQQGRRAQFIGEIEIIAGNSPLAVVYPLAGVVQHIFDVLLRSLGKLLHKGNAVLKADLRFVPFAAAPARLIVQRDDPKLHSKAIDVLAGLFPFHKIVAGAGGKAGLIGQLAGAVENPGFVFPVNAGGAGLALGAADLDVFGSVYLALQLAVACIWLAVTAVCYNARNIGFGVARPAATVLAFVVTTATWLAVWQFLRLGSWPLLISVFMIVWLADACAYFAGRLFGKNRMAPAISPKKTWEGVAGGLVSVLLAALAAYLWLPHEMVLTSILLDNAGFAAGLLMILVLVAVSVSGDLFESSLKRQAGVKDSGRLLPGHGGFYDRLDSSLAVLPTAAAMLMIV